MGVVPVDRDQSDLPTDDAPLEVLEAASVEEEASDVAHFRWRVTKNLTRRIDQYLVDRVGYLSRNIDGMKSEINERGLLNMFAWNLFDWAPMDTPSDGIVTHINCLAALGLKLTRIQAITGGEAYLAAFRAASPRPEPARIKPCRER